MNRTRKTKLSGDSPERRAEIGRQRCARTRQNLLNSAARLLAERVDRGLTIESLISEANVSRGTFYNYWDAREELVDKLWDYVGHNPFAAMQAAHDPVDDHAERLSIIACHSIRRAAENATWGWLVICIAALEAGIEAGRFRVESSAAARDMIVGTTIAGMRHLLRNKEPDSYPETWWLSCCGHWGWASVMRKR